MKTLARLFVNQPLTEGHPLGLNEAQSRYLGATLRAQIGDAVALFNGRDGEWLARVSQVAKRQVQLELKQQTRRYSRASDTWLVFAPVKNEKIDFIAKRATELGISRIQPVITQHTMVSRVNGERLQANVIEAAEQCGRVDVPEVAEALKLKDLLAGWDHARLLIHCDESGEGESPRTLLPSLKAGPCAVLIGPEGGFSPVERSILKNLPYIKRLSLGPTILRAETAAVAALANVQAWVVGW